LYVIKDAKIVKLVHSDFFIEFVGSKVIENIGLLQQSIGNL